MVIRSLFLKNFQSIAEFDEKFPDGTIVFFGENGQGKSTIFNAIAFCLTEYRVGSSWVDYVKSDENSMVVELIIQMSDNPEDLMVFSYSGDKTTEILSKEVVYSGRTYTTNLEVSAFLSSVFDQEMLENVVFSLQSSEPIAKLKPAQTRDIFKKIFNSDFPEVVQSLKDEAESKKKEEGFLEAQVNAFATKKYNYFDIKVINPAQLKTLKEELEVSQGNELTKQKYIRYAEKVSEFTNKQKALTGLFDRKARGLALIDTTKGTIEVLKAEKAKAESSEIESLKLDITSKMLSLDIDKEGLEQFKGTAKDWNKIIQENSNIIDERIRNGMSMEADIKGEISVLKTHIRAHEAGVCETCGQSTDANKAEEFKLQIEKLESKLLKFKDRIGELQTEKKEFSSAQYAEQSAYTSKVVEYQNSILAQEKTIQVLQIKKNNLEQEPKNIQVKIDSLLAEITRYQPTLSEIDDEILICNFEVTNLDKWCQDNKIEEKTSDSREVKEIQKEIDSILADIEGNKQKEILNKSTKEQETIDKDQITDLNKKVNVIQLRIKEIKTLQKIFDTEFPNFVNVKACAILETFMNNIFETIKPNFKVQVSQDKKGISLKYKAKENSPWIPAYMCSGFETALLSLSFKVSCSMLYGNTGPLILDEIDGPASDGSSERVFQVLSDIKGFKQIFVISHKPTAVSILKENGATVYEVANGTFTLRG